MSQPIVIRINRNVAIGLGVAALLLVAFGCSYFLFDNGHSPAGVVNVIQKKVDVPPELERVLTDLSVNGLILVSGGGQKNDPLTIRVIDTKGQPTNVCGLGTNPDKSPPASCELATTAAPLLSMATLAPTCGTCPDTKGTPRECHKDGTYKNKWYCHTTNERGFHNGSCKVSFPCGN